MLYMVYNNKNTLQDFNLGILTSNEHNRTQEVVEFVPIEMRKKGSLTKKTGTFKDIIINRTFRFLDSKEYDIKIAEIMDWLNNVEDDKLYFSNYPQRCYIVKNSDIKSIEDEKSSIIDINIVFTCEPFLKDTNEVFEEVANNSKIYNFGTDESEPNIKLTLPNYTQNIQITIGDKTLGIRDVKNDLLISTSLFSAISEGKYLNTTGNFPTLKKGENLLNWTSTINKFEILKNTLYRG